MGAEGSVFQSAEWRGKRGRSDSRWPDLWNYLGKDSSMYTADLVEHSEEIRVGILGSKGLKKIRQFLISGKKILKIQERKCNHSIIVVYSVKYTYLYNNNNSSSKDWVLTLLKKSKPLFILGKRKKEIWRLVERQVLNYHKRKSVENV